MPKEKLLNNYRNSDIFIMPSYNETFGLVYIEAMSQGLPIIYTQNEGVDGYFKEGSVGYSVKTLMI
jgi:glycosyltransferase involved in cell wall biosynthesis